VTQQHKFIVFPVLWMIALGGCKVVEAPETIEELVVFGFEHFGDEPEYLVAMGDNLFPLIEEDLEGLDTGFHVDNLGAEHLAAAGVEAPDVTSIIGALGAVEYSNSLDAVLCAVTYGDKQAIFDHYVEYEVVKGGNLSCFLDRECSNYALTYEQTVTVTLLGDSTQTVDRSFRWVEPDDGEPYVVSRGLAPDPVEFNTNIMEVDQQYDLYILQPVDGIVRRTDAFWVEARFLGADLPEYFVVDQAVSTMREHAEAIDEFINEFTDGDGGC